MRMRSKPTSVALALPALSLAVASLVACSEPTKPLDPDDLTARMAAHTREIVHQTGGGVAFAAGDDSGLEKLADGFNDASNGLAGAMPSPVPPAMMDAMMGGSVSMNGMPSMLTTEEQFDETADKLRTLIKERLFAAANLESKTDDEAVYLLRPDPTCRPLPKDEDPVGTVPPVASDCADKLTKLSVRLVLRAEGNGGRVKVLVGPNRLELSQLVVHSDLLAVESDLPKTYDAAKYIDETLGEDSVSPTRFETLAGKARLALRKLGDKKVSGSVSVLEPIRVATFENDGAPGPDLRLGASDPTFAVTADGVDKKLTFDLAVGAIDLRSTWNPLGKTTTPNRDLHVAIGGLYGRLTFDEGSDTLVGKGLGVGGMSYAVRGMPIYELGLNGADAHRFDLRVGLDGAGRTNVEVAPRFDLSLDYNFGLVASEYTTPPPSYVLDETYGVRLDNGGAPASFTSVPASGTFSGGIKLVAGTLTISSTAATSPVIVPSGKCLTGVKTAPQGTHPVLGALVVSDCP